MIENKDNAQKEFNLLKCLNNHYLIKLICDGVQSYDGSYYFLTEYYEVKLIFS